jgi:hypothetical protein
MEKTIPPPWYSLSGIRLKGAHVTWVDNELFIHPQKNNLTGQRMPAKKQQASPLAFSAL